MYYYLYKLTNKINGKIYVGVHQTDDVNDGYMGSGGDLLSRAKAKYGVESFDKCILEFFSSAEEMYAKEREIVNEEFVSRNDNYNVALGGRGGFFHINTEEMKEKYKDQRSKRMSGENNHFYGKTHTEEVKVMLAEKASKQWAGIPKSDEHKRKIAESNTGKTFSNERKKNISESKKGKSPKFTCSCGKIIGGSYNFKLHQSACKLI